MKKTGLSLLAIIVIAVALTSCAQFGKSSKTSPAVSAGVQRPVTAADIAPYVRNAITHDPSTIIKCKNEFWVFYTGRGVPSWHSKDLVNWVRGPSVFTNAPSWVAKGVPANRPLGYWAPDVAYVNGRYLLY